MFSTVRARLLLSYSVIILVTLVLVTGTIGYVLRNYRISLTRAQLQGTIGGVTTGIGALLRNNDTIPNVIETIRETESERGTNARILLVDRSGKVLGDTQDDAAVGLTLARFGDQLRCPNNQNNQRLVSEPDLTLPGGQKYVVAVGCANNPNAAVPIQRRIAVVILVPVNASGALVDDIGIRLLYATLAVLLVSAVLAVLVARSLSFPLAQITRATEEVARGNLDLNLDIRGPDEVRRLAQSFTSMAQQVKAARQAQVDFIANVSHDLKTPLTSIQGFSQALIDGTAREPEAQTRAVQIINDEATRMGRLVNELLDVARIDTGQTIRTYEAVGLDAILRDCVEQFSLRAQNQGVTLVYVGRDYATVDGDRDRLIQVFTNLIDNALKFTPSGGCVTLSTFLPGVKNGHGPTVDVCVADTGQGIPSSDLPRIFDRFYQVDKARTKRLGAGLGLAIVNEIVTAHGGQVRVESSVGNGTRLIVSLPVLGET